MPVKPSVIVTTYNSPQYLERSLEGLTLQTVLPLEVIIADDGSGPETSRLVSFFSEAAPFPVLHVWHEDKGFRAAKIRNEAIKRASGDYIIFLDGDCIPGRHFIEDHIALYEAGCFVQGKRVIVGPEASERFTAREANSIPLLIWMALMGKISNFHNVIRLPFNPASKSRQMKGIKSCNMGISREDLLTVNGFNEAFTGWGREDSELAVRLYKYGLVRKTALLGPTVFHLWHSENSREALARNDGLLEAALAGSEYRCGEGIFKEG